MKGAFLRRMPRPGWAALVAVAAAVVVVSLAAALNWSGRTTVAVGAITAFVLSAVIGPLLFGGHWRWDT